MAIKKPLVLTSGQVQQLQAADSVIGAGGGLRFQFDDDITSSDPGSGKIKFNLPPATEIYISETDVDGNSVAPWIASWDDSSATIHGTLFIMGETSGSLFIYNVVGSNTDNGSWQTIAVSEVVAGLFSDGEYVRVWFSRTGDNGADGTGGGGAFSAPGGRITLSSTLSVPTGDLTDQTTLYYLPHLHSYVTLYDGADWVTYGIGSGISGTIPSATSTAKPFDVFIYLDSTDPTIEFLEWTSTSARATAIVKDSITGAWIKSGDATRLYVGTIYVNTSGECSDTERYRHVWNYYNQAERAFFWSGPNTDWTYSASNVTRYANGGTGPTFSAVVGIAQNSIFLKLQPRASKSGANTTLVRFGWARDTTSDLTTPDTAELWSTRNNNRADVVLTAQAIWDRIVPLGYHEYNWVENTSANNATLVMEATGVTGSCSGRMVM